MLTGGITPFERGDGRGVLHTKTTARLKRERGLSGRALPREADGRIAVGAVREGAVERIKLVAELGKRVQCLHHRTLQILVDLSRGIVMTIDIAAIVGLAQQLHVVLAGKRADIVDLRNARQEELHRASRNIVLIVASQRRIVGAVDLIQVKIGCGGTGSGLRFAVSVRMNGVHEIVDILIRHEPLERTVQLIGTDVDHADAIMRVKHGDGIVRTDVGPMRDRLNVTGIQRVQQQRRKREIVDAIDLRRNLNLLLVVGMHFDEDFQAALDTLLTQTGDELERLRSHEAACAGFLSAVADGVETNVADVGCGHLIENRHQVFPTLVGIRVNVDLLRGETDPNQAGLACELVVGERQARTRTVDAGQILFGGAVREDGAHGQEHRVILGFLALFKHVLELLGLPAHVVDDGVDHDAVGLGKFGDIVPAAEARVDLGVVDGVEACIRAVEWSEERQDMHAVIHAVETGTQDVGHRAKSAIAETIGVSDELHSVFHGTSLGSWMRMQCVHICLFVVYVFAYSRMYRTGSILPRKGRQCPVAQ